MTFSFLSRGSWRDTAGVGWKLVELVCEYSVEPAETQAWNTVMLRSGSLSLEINFLQSSWQGNQSPCMAYMLWRPPARTGTGNPTHPQTAHSPACTPEGGLLLVHQLQTNSSPPKPMKFSAIKWAEPHFLQQGLIPFQVCPSLGTLPQR